MKTIKKICALILLGFAGYYLATTPHLTLKKVMIKGNNYTPKKNINTASLTQKHFLVSLWNWRKLKSDILSKNSAIESITFKHKKSQTWVITINEKKEWASYLTNHKHYIVSKDGTILNHDSQNPNISSLEDLVIIRGVSDHEFQGVKVNHKRIKDTQKIIANIKHYFPYKQMQIEFDRANHITLIKDDTLPIKIGPLTNLEKKFKNISTFFKAYPNIEKQCDYIDLRLKDRIIIKR